MDSTQDLITDENFFSHLTWCVFAYEKKVMNFNPSQVLRYWKMTSFSLSEKTKKRSLPRSDKFRLISQMEYCFPIKGALLASKKVLPYTKYSARRQTFSFFFSAVRIEMNSVVIRDILHKSLLLHTFGPWSTISG